MLSMSVPPWSSLGWIPVVIVYRCIFNQRYIVSFMHMYWSLSLLCIYVYIRMYIYVYHLCTYVVMELMCIYTVYIYYVM
jgi:hypothetical protein